jgi:hypothetical protein
MMAKVLEFDSDAIKRSSRFLLDFAGWNLCNENHKREWELDAQETPSRRFPTRLTQKPTCGGNKAILVKAMSAVHSANLTH